MKSVVVMTALLGVVTGMILRSGHGGRLPADRVVGPSLQEKERGVRSSKNSVVQLNWEICGDLNIDEFSQLVKGGRRRAEAALWMASASAEELAARWDSLSEDEEKNRDELGLLMQCWIEKDLEGALSHVRGTARELDFFVALARVEPDQALDLVKERGEYFQGITLSVVAENDPGKAMALLESCSVNSRSMVVAGIANGLMKDDPRQALDFLKGSGVFGHEHRLMAEWAGIDPQEALRWAIENQSATVHEAGDALILKDPVDFAKQVDAMTTGRLKNELRAKQAKAMAQSDPNAAVRWSHEMPVGTRVGMLLAIGPELDSGDVVLRQEVLSGLLSGGVDPNGGDYSILDHDWVAKQLKDDPQGFVSLAEHDAPDLLSSAAIRWAGEDGDGSFEWLSGLPGGESFDEIAGAVVHSEWAVKGVGYERALTLVDKVSNAETSKNLESLLLLRWKKGAPAGLQQYLNSGEATPAQLQWWEGQQ